MFPLWSVWMHSTLLLCIHLCHTVSPFHHFTWMKILNYVVLLLVFLRFLWIYYIIFKWFFFSFSSPSLSSFRSKFTLLLTRKWIYILHAFSSSIQCRCKCFCSHCPLKPPNSAWKIGRRRRGRNRRISHIFFFHSRANRLAVSIWHYYENKHSFRRLHSNGCWALQRL